MQTRCGDSEHCFSKDIFKKHLRVRFSVCPIVPCVICRQISCTCVKQNTGSKCNVYVFMSRMLSYAAQLGESGISCREMLCCPRPSLGQDKQRPAKSKHNVCQFENAICAIRWQQLISVAKARQQQLIANNMNQTRVYGKQYECRRVRDCGS